MKFAVISDIHSNLDALNAVIRDLPEYDELLCLGDVVGYGPQPNEVIDKFRQLKPSVVLMGNHDYAVVTGDTAGFSEHATRAVEWTRGNINPENQNYLAALRPSGKLRKDGRSIALFHGSPRDPLSEYVFPGIPEVAIRRLIQESDAEILLLGHTHVPMSSTFGKDMLGNPGSVGQPRDGDPRASYATLTSSGLDCSFEVKRVEYDVAPVAERILRAGLPEFLAERLYIGM